MSKTLKTIQEGQRGLFEQQFIASNEEQTFNAFPYRIEPFIHRALAKEVNQTTIATLQSLIEDLEGRKEDEETGLVRGKDEQDMDLLSMSYNQAIQDTITDLEKIISELRKNV